MSCPTELEWSMYVDAALARDEAARLETHLASCAACRASVSALETESRALRAVLAEDELPTAIPAFRAPPQPRGYRAAAALVIALASSSLVLGEALGSLSWPEPLAWLNPFTRSGAIELVLGAFVFIATEGRSMLISAIETAGAAVIVALLVAAALAAARKGGGAAVFSVALAALAVSGQSQALEIRRADNLVSVPAGETIDDTVIALGQNVEIDGTVTGDLIAFGQRVVIRGTVGGQLVTGARTVVVEGDLGGSVLGFAETLTFGGVIDRDLYGFARQFTAAEGADVRGNAVVFASNASLGAPVGKDVLGFAGEIEVSGTIGGDLNAHAGAVRVLGPARIDGDVIAHVGNENDLQVSPGATIAGAVRTEIDADRDRETGPGPAARTGSFLAREAVSFGAAFLTGLILLWLVPPIARMSLDTAGEVVTSAGIGLVTLVAVPIIAIMTGITLIGLPIAILGVLAWIAALYLAKIVVAHSIGRTLFERAGRPAHFALVLLVGLLLVFVAINVPLLGVLVNFVLTIVGLGMLVIFIWGLFQDRPMAADTRV